MSQDHHNFDPVTHLRWLYLDLNSYFASVEQQEKPDLRYRPVAVIPGVSEDHTCAIAASYEAKAYGIKTGTKILEAKKICPDLACVPARHEVYVQYHNRIFELIGTILPVEKIYSIDEASFYLDKTERSPERAREIAAEIKALLRKEIGPFVKCSIGIAPNKLLAKIAAGYHKPDGLTLFEPHNYQNQLCQLQLSALPGIGKNMQARLFKAGIFSIEKFMACSPKHIRKIWKSVEGERFWYKLHGYDIPSLETQRSVIGHSRILDPELREADKAYNVLHYLTTKAASRLRNQKLCAGKISISLKFSYDSPWGELRFSREQSLAQTQDTLTFCGIVSELWQTIMRPYGFPRVAKVSVSLHDLRASERVNYDLFEKTIPHLESTKEKPKEKNHKRTALCQLADHLNELHGPRTIRFGEAPKTSAGYVGTKIAFNRIPDGQEIKELLHEARDNKTLLAPSNMLQMAL